MAIGIGAAMLGSAAMGMLGGAGSAAASAAAAKAATERQIEWERERAQNAHQWEVKDLKAAGLNPILSAGGSGATTGGISAPLPDYSGIAEAGGSIGKALEIGMQMQKNSAEINNLNANTANTVQNTENLAEQRKLIVQQVISEMAKSGLISAQKANLELKNVEQKFQNQHQKLTYWNNFINTSTSSAANAAKAGDTIVGHLWNTLKPKKGDKGYREFQEFGKNWKETTREYP